MQQQVHVWVTKLSVILLLAGCITGCGPMGPAMPERKKMPALDNTGIGDYSMTTIGGLPLYTGRADLMFKGHIQSYVAVSMPDASFDSLLTDLVRGYQPLAASLLAGWAQQREDGILLDFRADSRQEGERADYVLRGGNGVSVPVTFLWNRATGTRAAFFMQELNTTPGIECLQAGQYNHTGMAGQTDCFSGAAGIR